MLRLPAARATSSSSGLLSRSFRGTGSSGLIRPVACRSQTTTAAHGHAVSNPTLANIEKRWEQMPPQEQAELWMALRDRMTVDWHELTMQEKKASYWIAFGPHGPRAQIDPREKWEVLKIVMYCLAATGVAFAITRYFSRGTPKTMTREWQELTNEYLKKQRVEPITGISSEGYTGPGMIQSKPSGKKPGEDDEDEE